MTIEEATNLAEWIQRAFPHMRMEPRLYVRTLVHYDFEASGKGIGRAIEDNWKRLPNVAEMVEVLKACKAHSSVAQCETCHGDRLVLVGVSKVGTKEYAACPTCHPASGTNYLRGSITNPERALDPAKVRELMKQ